MITKKHQLVVLLVLMLVVVFGLGTAAAAGEMKIGIIEHGEYERNYEYYVPSGYDDTKAVSLVLSFHGLGSDPGGQMALTELVPLAEDEGFIVVFPNSTALEGDHPDLPALPGATKQWNIGVPRSLQYFAEIDDIGFTAAIIDELSAEYKIDHNRIFATGMSNGAMFSYYLAAKIPDKIAGIAAVTSPMPVNILEEELVQPTTVIIMMGTEDPIVSYEGLEGFTLTTDETVDFWVNVNGITDEPEVTYLPQTVEDDPTRIKRTTYSGGIDDTEVILYTIEGGGHTWPSGPQYYPPEAIGLVSYHIDGSAVIWEHFMGDVPAESADRSWVYFVVAGALLLIIVIIVVPATRKKSARNA